MRFLIELEGPVFDVAAAYHAAHQAAAQMVGWSRLDAATFWRLYRTKGREADFLPAAKPVKIAEYQRCFDGYLDAEEMLRTYRPQTDVAVLLGKLARYGPCHAVTLGANLAGRRARLVEAGLADRFADVAPMNADPRRRPGELALLAGSDTRAIVVTGSDAMVRAARSAELLAVGLTNGPCVAARLHQAGADVVYHELVELVDSLQQGAPDLVRAGLRPGF